MRGWGCCSGFLHNKYRETGNAYRTYINKNIYYIFVVQFFYIIIFCIKLIKKVENKSDIYIINTKMGLRQGKQQVIRLDCMYPIFQ